MGKIGSIGHFPRALPASIWGHCSQILVFFYEHKRGVTMTFFVLFFPAYGYLGPRNSAKRGKTHNDKSTLAYPLTLHPSPLPRRAPPFLFPPPQTPSRPVPLSPLILVVALKSPHFSYGEHPSKPPIFSKKKYCDTTVRRIAIQ